MPSNVTVLSTRAISAQTVIAFMVWCAIAGPAGAATGYYQRVSVASDGSQANGASSSPALGGAGQCVAFVSTASNLVAGDSNNVSDIFVFDRPSRITTRESVASDGSQANAASQTPAISDDCRFIVFQSSATNLVPGSSGTQIYVRDRTAKTTVLASISNSGAVGNAPSAQPAISGDGRVVAFLSDASNLVSGDTNGCADVFARDLVGAVTTRDNVSSNGIQATCTGSFSLSQPSLSRNGRYIAFDSNAATLVTGLSANGDSFVFVRDRLTGQTTVESTRANSFSPSLSADGRYVAFKSISAILSIWLRDRTTGASWAPVLSAGPVAGPYGAPRVSADGRFVSFWHDVLNLPVQGGDFARVYDRVSDTHWDASQCCPGSVPSAPSVVAGNVVAFVSASTALVDNDTNGVADIFIADLTQAAPPGAPRNLMFALVDSVLTLTWSAPADGGPPTSYVVGAGSTSMRADLASLDTQSTSTSFSATIGGGGPYYIRVGARNDFGFAASNEILVRPGSLLPPPGVPGEFSATTSGSTVTLKWSAPTTGGAPTGYVLQSGPYTFPLDFKIATGNTATTFTATGVPADSYFMQVRATNDAGTSAASTAVSFVVLGTASCSSPPTAPSGLASSVTGSTVNFTWTAGAGLVTSYVIEAGSLNGLTDLASFDTGGIGTMLTASSVASGTYFVRVRGKNACGVSAPSNEVLATIRAIS